MRESFVETLDFAYVSSQLLPTYDEPSICAFLEQAVAKGAEGLMLKLLGAMNPKLENNNNDDKAQTLLDDSAGQESTSTTTNSPYEAGTRSHSWLKVKRDYVAGYADTIDVVPIGAWYGHGRKAQKSFLSPVLLAVYDDEEEVYRSICRCMSFTDAMYEAMREFYFRGTPYPEHVGVEKVTTPPQAITMDSTMTTSNQALNAIPEKDDNDEDDENEDGSSGDENEDELDDGVGGFPTSMNDGMDDAGSTMVNCFPNRPSSAYIVTNESPPIWFRPMEVFEVSFADMSLSKQHSAAAGLVDDDQDRGVALRFPRFKRRRPDKTPEQATTSRQIAQLFLQQSKQASNNNNHPKRKQPL
jgi:ATP-dependent DNA ligase